MTMKKIDGHRTISRRGALRIMGLGAGTLGLGAGIAACAPSPEEEDRAEDTSDGPEDFAFASWGLADDASKDDIQTHVDTFADAHAIRISGVPFAYDDYLQQLTLQVRGGQFAGAAQLDINWLGPLVALGKLRDLGPVAEGAGYTETGLLSGQFDGVQYGLPWTTAAIGLVANKEYLEEAGITEPPATIEDFEAALTELKALDVIPYAGMTKVAHLKDILAWMETFGSPIVEGGRVTIGDDASVEAVAWYKKLFDDGLIVADVDRVDARNLFSQGRTAMYEDAIVGKAFVVAESPDPDLLEKLEPWPRPVLSAGDTPRAHQWGHILVVVDGEGAGTAAQFARWLTSDDDAVLEYFEALGLPPATDAALASDIIQGDEFTSRFTDRITATATPNPLTQFPQFAQMESAVAEQVQAVLTNGASPKDAMKEAGEVIQAMIDG